MRSIPPVKKGDTVLIITPAKSIDHSYVKKAEMLLHEWGLNVEIGRYALGSHLYFSGTDDERAVDLQWALDHPTAKVILCSRGGYGIIRVIDKVNFDKFAINPKWIVGFSDVTIIHNIMNAQIGFESVHGTVPLQFKDLESNSETFETLRKALFNEELKISFSPTSNNRNGNTVGELVGGNLAILESLIGTDLDINTNGKILFIEEVSEYAYKLDRMMWSLKKSGKLDKLAGFVVGGLTDIKECVETFNCTPIELITSFVSEYNYPVAFKFPAGHQLDNRALVLGANYTLEVKESQCNLIKQ